MEPTAASTHSQNRLNCVRGEAMHGIIHYSLTSYASEKTDWVKLKAGYPRTGNSEILEKKLTSKSNPAWLCTQCMVLSSHSFITCHRDGWNNILTAIFPEDEEKTIYWRAAWDAYIFASNVYETWFWMSFPNINDITIIEPTQDEQTHLGGSPNERLAQHIMFVQI